LTKLLHLRSTHPESGVQLTCGVELFRRKEKSLPTWSSIPPNFEMLSDDEICRFNLESADSTALSRFNEQARNASGGLPLKWGYRLQAPVALMKTYLPWLYSLSVASGVSIIQRQITSLDECFKFGDVVVNCTGYRAKELVADSGLIPVKGEYVSYPRDASCPSEYIGDDEHPEETSYIMPIGNEVLVGGSEEMGKEDLSETRTADQLLKRIAPLAPWAKDRIGKQPTRHVTGYRPYRKQGVAFGLRTTKAGTVIDNFGHGGSGFSLAWGCAESVKELIEA